jgi:tight adherence protein C
MDALNTAMNILEFQQFSLIVQLLIFLSASMMVYGLMLWLTTGKENIRRRLDEIKQGVGEQSHEPHAEGVFQVRWAKSIAEIALPRDEWKKSRVRMRLIRAGFRELYSIYRFYAAKVIIAIILPLAVVVPLMATGYIPITDQFSAVSIMVGAALVGYFLPHLYIASKIKERKLEFVEGFPDAMDLLVVCVEAGLGLDAAIQRVGKEMAVSYPELAIELGILNLELRAGKSRAEALKSLAERTDVEQVQSLVALLIQAEHFGTSIATALRDHADEMRQMRIQRAKEKAAKLPVKMLFPLVFFIFPALFIVVLVPAAIRIYVSLIGGTIS